MEDIKHPIADEMSQFEERFKSSLKSAVPLLNHITHYIIKRKGKQMRPMFVFLSARMFGPIKDDAYVAASLIELLHTATLVHDDVVDDAYKRRGFFSINAIWKNKVAVLVGDYLLSKGLLLSIDNEQYKLLQIVSRAVRDMSEGELLQMEKTRRLNIEESVYFDIIRQKTASLIAACCACGAAAGDAKEDEINRMRQFGEYAGMAFQIKDDLFDYGEGGDIGKPEGIDIKEKKLTLPLIYTLNSVDKKTRKHLIGIVKNHNKNKEKVKEAIQLVVSSGGIEYAVKVMQEFRQKALDVLHEFPESDARNSIEKMVNFTVNRNI